MNELEASLTAVSGSVEPHPVAGRANRVVARNDYIQYLRGFAAILVVIDHAVDWSVRRDSALSAWKPLGGELGAYGVFVFFVISGYIMMAIAFNQFGRPSATVRFWLARWRRIVPLYYLATIIALVWPLTPHDWSASRIVESFLFIGSGAKPDPTFMAPILGPGWTLDYEMFFYLLFGLALMARRRIGMILLFGALFGLVFLGKAVPSASALANQQQFRFYTFHILLLFAAGMALALFQHSRWSRLLPLLAPSTIGIALGVAIVAALQFLLRDNYPLWRTLLIYAASIMPVALAVVALPRAPNRTLEMLGDASFSIYLFHEFALQLLIRIWVAWFGTTLLGLRILVPTILAVAFSVLVYRNVELSLTRVLRSRSRREKEEL